MDRSIRVFRDILVRHRQHRDLSEVTTRDRYKTFTSYDTVRDEECTTIVAPAFDVRTAKFACDSFPDSHLIFVCSKFSSPQALKNLDIFGRSYETHLTRHLKYCILDNVTVPEFHLLSPAEKEEILRHEDPKNLHHMIYQDDAAGRALGLRVGDMVRVISKTDVHEPHVRLVIKSTT